MGYLTTNFLPPLMYIPGRRLLSFTRRPSRSYVLPSSLLLEEMTVVMPVTFSVVQKVKYFGVSYFAGVLSWR